MTPSSYFAAFDYLGLVRGVKEVCASGIMSENKGS